MVGTYLADVIAENAINELNLSIRAKSPKNEFNLQ